MSYKHINTAISPNLNRFNRSWDQLSKNSTYPYKTYKKGRRGGRKKKAMKVICQTSGVWRKLPEFFQESNDVQKEVHSSRKNRRMHPVEEEFPVLLKNIR